jgi:hypothetical protein
MLAPELLDELRAIAYCEVAKPKNRVSALNSLSKAGVDTPKVRKVLYELATDMSTPDDVKVRAIDLLAKLQTDETPKDLDATEVAALQQSLMEQYVGDPKSSTGTL